MLPRLAIIGVCGLMLIVAGCHRWSIDSLFGTWRSEDENRIEELTLNRDNSFRSVASYKQIFAIPSVPILVGTWRMRGSELLFDATLTFDNSKESMKRTLAEVTRNTLMLTNSEDRKTVKYQRFNLPSCSGRTVTGSQPVHESDLIGLWQIHYNTHDYEFRFMPSSRYELYGHIEGKWESLHSGSWHLAGNQITCQSDKTPYTDNHPQTWTIALKGIDCLAMGDGHSPETAFRRVE